MRRGICRCADSQPQTRHHYKRDLHFDELGAVNVLADSLASDLSREDEVLEDGFVDCLEGTASGSHLLCARFSGWLWHHSTLSDEEDVDAREFLFQLTGQSVTGKPNELMLGQQTLRTDLIWILWKALSWGTGTKMTIAFLPPLTSTSLAAEI